MRDPIRKIMIGEIPQSRPPQNVDVLAVLVLQIHFFFALRLLFCISEACRPTTKAMNENSNVHDDFRDGNKGFRYLWRRGRRRALPREPCLKDRPMISKLRILNFILQNIRAIVKIDFHRELVPLRSRLFAWNRYGVLFDTYLKKHLWNKWWIIHTVFW